MVQIGAVVVEAGGASWRATAEPAARRLSAITAAGALLGVLVGGVGGRLAMLLLARVNPAATGMKTDDSFTIGQFTVSGSANLLIAGLLLGLLGSAFYAALRGLMIGPRWFQVLSISTGPAVVVGTLLVHTDGVDFTVLEPLWLTVGLFVLIPGVFVAALTLLAERWMSVGGWSTQGSLPVVLAPLLLWVVVFPLLPAFALLLLGWVVVEAARRTAVLGPWVGGQSLRWVARGGLAALFVVAAVDLVRDVSALS